MKRLNSPPPHGEEKISFSPLEVELGVFFLANPLRVADVWDLLSKYTPTTPQLGELRDAFAASMERYDTPVFAEEFLSEETHHFWARKLRELHHIGADLSNIQRFRDFLEEKVRQQTIREHVEALRKVVSKGAINATTILEYLHMIYNTVGGGERDISTNEIPSLLSKFAEGTDLPHCHPFPFLQEAFGYPIYIFHKDLSVIAGRTGRGKTTVTLNLALSYLLEGKRVCYITTEMSEIAVATRFAAMVGGVPWDAIWSTKVDKEAISRAIAELEPLVERGGGIFFFHAPYCTTSHISYALGKAKAAFGGADIDCLVVDYIQQIVGEGKADTRAQELASIARFIADIGTHYNCAAVVVSQVNDEGEIKDSRAIAERAALVVKLGMLSPARFVDYLLSQVGIVGYNRKPGYSVIVERLAPLTKKYLDVSVEKNRYGYFEAGKIRLLSWDARIGRIRGVADPGELAKVVWQIVEEVERGYLTKEEDDSIKRGKSRRGGGGERWQIYEDEIGEDKNVYDEGSEDTIKPIDIF